MLLWRGRKVKTESSQAVRLTTAAAEEIISHTPALRPPFTNVI